MHVDVHAHVHVSLREALLTYCTAAVRTWLIVVLFPFQPLKLSNASPSPTYKLNQHFCAPQCGRVWCPAPESALYSAACCLAFLRLASRSSGGRARPVSWLGLGVGLGLANPDPNPNPNPNPHPHPHPHPTPTPNPNLHEALLEGLERGLADPYPNPNPNPAPTPAPTPTPYPYP